MKKTSKVFKEEINVSDSEKFLTVKEAADKEISMLILYFLKIQRITMSGY